jgi:hypothetical protein
MQRVRQAGILVRALAAVAAVALWATGSAAFADHKPGHVTDDMHMTGVFKGVKVNGGTVTHSTQSPKNVLTLSEDFVVPDTPAPHWQVVDSKGNVYLLNRLTIKEGKYNKSIVVPAYVKDIAKVQIWCAFAETLLGEASFERPVG